MRAFIGTGRAGVGEVWGRGMVGPRIDGMGVVGCSIIFQIRMPCRYQRMRSRGILVYPYAYAYAHGYITTHALLLARVFTTCRLCLLSGLLGHFVRGEGNEGAR